MFGTTTDDDFARIFVRVIDEIVRRTGSSQAWGMGSG